MGDVSIRIGEHRSSDIEIVFCPLWRTPAGTAGGGEARLDALPDQATLELCQRLANMKTLQRIFRSRLLTHASRHIF